MLANLSQQNMARIKFPAINDNSRVRKTFDGEAEEETRDWAIGPSWKVDTPSRPSV